MEVLDVQAVTTYLDRVVSRGAKARKFMSDIAHICLALGEDTAVKYCEVYPCVNK
jgi:hypothetical protein